MSKINRRYIDKHWMVFVLRGGLAVLFGLLLLFNGLRDTEAIGLPLGMFLLCMGAIDAASAIFNSTKKRGWLNSLVDAAIDVVAALVLLFAGRNSLVTSVVTLAVYTFVSGLIDVFHGFLSTVDPTDRFIRVLAGIAGCVIGIVILNAGGFDVVEFYRFFGVYALVVGITSLIYGVHNREQMIEAREAMREMAQERAEAKGKTLAKTARPRFWERLLGNGGAAKKATPRKKETVETKLPKKEQKVGQSEHKTENTEKVGKAK